jgi:predicted nucleic acid-binding protein
MDVLIDTNILIDFLDDRRVFSDEAGKIFQNSYEGKLKGYIAAHSIPDIFYILRKDYSVEARKEMLLGLCNTMEVVGIDKQKLVSSLLNTNFNDFEDCIHMECAKSVGAKYIVTRDPDDFANSDIPAISPQELLEKIDK